MDVGEVDKLDWADFEEKTQIYLSKASVFEIRRRDRNLINQNHLSQIQISALQLFQHRRSFEANSGATADPMEDDEGIADDKEEVEDIADDKNEDETAENESSTTSKEPFRCPFCNKTYLSVKTLQAHIRHNHKEEEQVKSKEYDSQDQMMICQLQSKTDANKK